jgi:hypothetical protein
MQMLDFADYEQRLAAAEFERFVLKYQLHWAHEPSRLYPVADVGWPPAGWMPMIERLVIRLIKLGWDRHLSQVKVKFGGLRFYVGGVTPAARAVIDKVQARSLRICDDCGKPGRQHEEEGTSVRCEKHRARTGKPMGIKLVARSRPSAASHLKRRKP